MDKYQKWMSNVHTFAASSDFCWSIEIFGSYPFIILHFRGKGLVVLVVVVSGAAILVGFADQCGDLTSHNDHVNLQIGGPCCHGKCQHDPKGLEDPSSKDILSNCVDRKMKYMLFCINIKILICIYIYTYVYISHICWQQYTVSKIPCWRQTTEISSFLPSTGNQHSGGPQWVNARQDELLKLEIL